VVVFGVMMVLLLVGTTVAIYAETRPRGDGRLAVTGGRQPGGRKCAWAGCLGDLGTITTPLPTLGNGHARRFQPLGGWFPWLDDAQCRLQRYRAGFLNMLMYIIVAVFLAD